MPVRAGGVLMAESFQWGQEPVFWQQGGGQVQLTAGLVVGVAATTDCARKAVLVGVLP